MPRALFTSKNLIGDGLYIQPALEKWVEQHQGWEIDLLTNDDHITDMYTRMGIPNLRIVFDRYYKEYDFEFNFDVSEAFKISDQYKAHISIAYGMMLGVEVLPNTKVKYIPSDLDDHEKGLIMFSCFSNSCASRKGEPPNKMISWSHWLPILTICRQMSNNGRVIMLGGPGEKAALPMDDSEYYLGIPLDRVARMMRDSKLVITIDNGMGHLAATQGAPTVLFYPKILGTHYIVPSGNSKLRMIQMDPNQLEVYQAVDFVRLSMRSLFLEEYHEGEQS